MSIYAISDLHLSLSTDKPMNVFHGWENYVEQIKSNWTRLVTDQDTVVIPGDISWALKIDEAIEDFKFIDSLPGKKVIIKGNHDLWWGTMNKLLAFFEKNEIKTIFPVFNSYYEAEGKAICGSRGWNYDSKESEEKIILREANRLDTSITAAEKNGLEPIVFTHFPPVYGEFVCDPIIEVLNKHNIKHIYHGHIHGAGRNNSVPEWQGIKFTLISCDCIDFTPILVSK